MKRKRIAGDNGSGADEVSRLRDIADGASKESDERNIQEELTQLPREAR